MKEKHIDKGKYTVKVVNHLYLPKTVKGWASLVAQTVKNLPAMR